MCNKTIEAKTERVTWRAIERSCDFVTHQTCHRRLSAVIYALTQQTCERMSWSLVDACVLQYLHNTQGSQQ